MGELHGHLPERAENESHAEQSGEEAQGLHRPSVPERKPRPTDNSLPPLDDQRLDGPPTINSAGTWSQSGVLSQGIAMPETMGTSILRKW
jgi:hypothetical protein